MQDNQRITSVLEAIIEGQEHPDIDNALAQVFEYYDIEKYAFVDISITGQEKNIKGFLTTYPKPWQEHYIREKYCNHDPVFLSYGKMQLPFTWDQSIVETSTKIQQKIFKDAADFNIRQGTTIPLLPRAEGQSFVTVLDHLEIPPYISYTITLATQLYFDRKRIIDANQRISTLTYREKEILQMKSQGLSIKIIAHRLGISDSTIIFHLRNIRQKLKATSLAHALFLFGLASAQTIITKPK